MALRESEVVRTGRRGLVQKRNIHKYLSHKKVEKKMKVQTRLARYGTSSDRNPSDLPEPDSYSLSVNIFTYGPELEGPSSYKQIKGILF